MEVGSNIICSLKIIGVDLDLLDLFDELGLIAADKMAEIRMGIIQWS
jgi:hypothetical protein